MSEEDSQGIISPDELKTMAQLFDQCENALNPSSIQCREARVGFIP